MAFTKFELLTSPSFEKIRILTILFLTTQRGPRKFPASTAVPVLTFPSSYLKVPTIERRGERRKHTPKSIQELEDKLFTNYFWYTLFCFVICCTALCCFALRCGMLRCKALHCVVLRWTTLRYAVLRCTALSFSAQCCAALRHVVLLCAALHYAILCYATLRCAALLCAMLTLKLCCTVLCYSKRRCTARRYAAPHCPMVCRATLCYFASLRWAAVPCCPCSILHNSSLVFSSLVKLKNKKRRP